MPDMSKRFEHEPVRRSRLEAVSEPRWRRHEKHSAARTKGLDRPRPGRGDGTAYEGLFLRECKHTIGASLGVKKAWLEKIDSEATVAGLVPVLVLGFDGMKPGVDGQWACVPLGVFNEMVRAWGEAKLKEKA